MNFLTYSFLKKNQKIILPFCIILFFITMMISLYMVFFKIPDDYLQGNLVKIMYIHVPSAWLALGIYTTLSIFSILYLIYRNNYYDLIAEALAPIGAIFCLITLITGSIWGRPAWGAFWVWDARLTSSLILFFIYLTYITLKSNNNSAYFSSIFAVFGLINIPIIKISVELWNTLHQPSSVLRFDGIKIDKEFLYPLFCIFLSLALYTAILAIYRIEKLKLERKYKKLLIRKLFL